MATPKRVTFSPTITPSKPAEATSSNSNGIPLPDDFEERPTLLRIKRRREELALDIVVLEAQQPSRKKKTMKELTDALKELKVADELHQQFQAHLKAQQTSKANNEIDKTQENGSKTTVPPTVWSLPSKTLEKEMRKVFRLIGTDEDSKTLLNDVQSGRAKQRDIINAISKKSFEQERKARIAEFRKNLADQRSYHLLRVQQEVQRRPDEPVDDDEGMCRILELVSKDKSEKTEKPAPSKQSQVGIQLPIVHSARKLKEMEQQRLAAEAADKDEYVTSYYVLDEYTQLEEIGDFTPLQVPLSEFRSELLEEFVLEGEYSDSDREAESSDSQNRSEEWDYGSDPSEDGKQDAGSRSSSDDEDDENESDKYENSDLEDEIMDEAGDYYHDRYRHRGYEFEIDPNDLALPKIPNYGNLAKYNYGGDESTGEADSDEE